MNAPLLHEKQDDLRIIRLVNHLYDLQRNANRTSHARRALAELRRGLRGDPRDQLVVGKHVVPFLGEMKQPDEGWFYLVAALFASHPLPTEGMSLGKAFQRIKDDSGSTEKRFLNIVAADADHLRPLLRQAVALLAINRRPVGLDWKMLLYDLLAWDRQELPVQHRWAREFFQKSSNDDDAADNTRLSDDDITQGDTNDEN